MGNPRSSTRKEWMLPSTRQLLWVAALSGLGYLLWQENAATRVRERLWDSSASPTELIRAANQWSKQGAQAVPALVEALSNENPQTRRYAVMGLCQMGSAARPAIPDLLRVLRDEHPFVRREAVCALAVLDKGSASSGEAVAELLGDPDPSVQRETITALSNWGEAALPMTQARLTHANPVARKLALEVLSNVISDRLEVARLAQPLTEDPDVEVQSAAIRLVFRADAATEAQVVKWISHDEEPLRLLAIHALNRDALPLEAIGPLISCIKRGPMLPAVTRLQQYGAKAIEAVPILLEALESSSDWDASQLLATLQTAGCDATTLADRSYKLTMKTEGAPAAMALSILKTIDPERMQREIDRRIEQLQGEDVARVRATCGTFQGLPSEDVMPVLPHFESLLFGDDREVRSRALSIIRSARADRSITALAQLLDSPEIDQFVEELALTIEAIGPPAEEALHLPILRRIRGLRTSAGTSKPSDASRRRLMITAARIGIRSQDFADFLFLALDDPSISLRMGALVSLGYLGSEDERVLKGFLKSLDSPEPLVRLAAAGHILDAVGPRTEVVEGLIPLLVDEDLRIRGVAAISLARMENKASSALVPLREALNDPGNDLPTFTISIELRKPVPGFYGLRSVSEVIRLAIERIEASRADVDD